MENKKLKLGAIMVIIAAIMWGLDGVVLTPNLTNLPVPFVVFLLHCVPFVFMSVFFYKEFKVIKNFKKDHIIIFSLIAIFGGAVGTISIVKALFLVNFEHLSIVVLLQKLQPIFSIILARILLKEKLGKNFIVWTLFALIAVYLLTFGFNLPSSNSSNISLAAFYSILAAFSFGSSTVFGKYIMNIYDYKTVTFYRYGFTTLFMIVFLTMTKGFVPISYITKTNWIILLIITFTTGAGAIALYYYGLKFINAKISTICELAFPLSTVVFDYLIHGNKMSTIQWISAGIL
ncbi:MAG: DMT family transporter, partial [Clostridiales bacterium]